jgi:hypothetical protein
MASESKVDVATELSEPTNRMSVVADDSMLLSSSAADTKASEVVSKDDEDQENRDRKKKRKVCFPIRGWESAFDVHFGVIYRTAEIAIADVAATGAPGEATKEVTVTGVVRETVVAVVLTVASAMTVTAIKSVPEILRKTRRLQ